MASRGLRITFALVVLTGSAALVRSFLPEHQSGFEVLPNELAIVGAVAAGASILLSRRLARLRAVLAALWGSAALLAAKAADGIAFDVVGVIMKAVATVTGDVMVVELPVDPAGIVVRLLAGVTAVAVGGHAIRNGRDLRGACSRCGRGAGGRTKQPPVAMAYAACALALGYAAEKVYWGLGGTIGLTGEDALGEDVGLWTPGLGDTAVLALIGAGIALALARPWGAKLPRWMPIAGAGLGAMMLVPVGILGTATALANLSEPAADNAVGLEPWVFLIEYPWFLAWGVTLGLAAVGFHLRTRGRCNLCGRGGELRPDGHQVVKAEPYRPG